MQEMLGTDGTLPSAASVKVDGVNPQPSDDTEGSLWDLVMHGTGISVPRSAASDDAYPAPRSLGVADMGVSGLLLPGSPSFPPPPINWRRVGDNAMLACSQVTATERLLHKTLSPIKFRLV
jgi:hypothetical protein